MTGDDTDPLAEVARAREELDHARSNLYAKIRAAFDAGYGPSAIGRAAKYTREHTANIHKGKVKDART